MTHSNLKFAFIKKRETSMIPFEFRVALTPLATEGVMSKALFLGNETTTRIV